jgi:peptidoglycan/xylan/chitin deacetylase (PgdA/CDA1 family)
VLAIDNNLTKPDIINDSEYSLTINKNTKKIENSSEDKALYDKEIFLTFDDGPSKNTPKILKILKENDVKATFFVIGNQINDNKDVIKDMDESGMCIAVHTYSHRYDIMYKSVDAYMDDLNKCFDSIYNITGKQGSPYVRLPGGSDNKVCNAQILNQIKQNLKDKNIYYIDWNVDSEDATGNNVPPQKIVDTIIKESAWNKVAVSLNHDAPLKVTTVEALPKVIKELKDRGYIFRTLNDITATEIETLIKTKVINR